MRIATLLAAAALAAISVPSAATAGDGVAPRPPPPPDPVAEATRLTAEGIALADAGDMLGAAARFRAAHGFDPRTDRLCNVGITFHKAKDLPRAHLYLGQCLTRVGSLDAAVATSVRAVFAATEDALRAGKFAPIDVAVSPGAATLTISSFDPEDAMIGARLVWLPFGDHRITARADGHVDRSVDVHIEEPARQPVRIVLERTPAVDPPPPRTTLIRPHARRPAIIATAGTGVVGAGALVAFLLARSAATDAGEVGISETEYDARVESARFRQRLSWGLAGTAAVGAAISGWLWYRSTQTQTVVIEVSATADGAAATLGGRF